MTRLLLRAHQKPVNSLFQPKNVQWEYFHSVEGAHRQNYLTCRNYVSLCFDGCKKLKLTEEMGGEPATKRVQERAIEEKKQRDYMAQKYIELTTMIPGLKKVKIPMPQF